MYTKDTQPQKDNLIEKCHGVLCNKIEWYSKWHSNPQSNLIHIFLLSAAIIFFLQYNFPDITNKFSTVINGASVESSSPEQETLEDPESVEGQAPEIPVCVDPQILVENVCTDPAPVVAEETPVPVVEEIPAPAEEILDSTSSPQAAPVEEIPESEVVTPAPVVEEILDSTSSPQAAPVAPVLFLNSDPVVRSISSPIIKGTFKSGIVPIIITFNKAVEVSGTPQLILSTGTPDTTAVDLKFAFGNRLYFLYHIVDGNSSLDLDYASSSAIDLNGGSIQDLSGNDADLDLPEPGSSGSLSSKGNIIIETEQNDI